MFENLTDRSRLVVVLAQEDARSSGQSFIGTEQLLLGLIKEGEGVAAIALHDLGISLELVRAELEEPGGQDEIASAGHIPFSPHAKRVLERSLHEARRLGDSRVGTEHILLGLISVDEGVGAQTLVKLGLDLHRVREEVLRSRFGGSEPMNAG